LKFQDLAIELHCSRFAPSHPVSRKSQEPTPRQRESSETTGQRTSREPICRQPSSKSLQQLPRAHLNGRDKAASAGEAEARLHKDCACRACRGYKSKTDRCRRIVQCRCKLIVWRTPPIESKISPKNPLSPWLNKATFLSLVLRLTSTTPQPSFPILEFCLGPQVW
jgi:hypothetical protein